MIYRKIEYLKDKAKQIITDMKCSIDDLDEALESEREEDIMNNLWIVEKSFERAAREAENARIYAQEIEL